MFTDNLAPTGCRNISPLLIQVTIAAFLVPFLAYTASADTALPACETDGESKNSKVRIDGVVLEKTTMDEILNAYGKAQETVSKVEECCTQRAVCYLSPSKNLAVEYGGWTSSNITSFRISNDKHVIGSMRSCAISSKLAQPISISTGLRLGMSKSDVVHLLGEPTRKFSTRDDEIEYDFKCHPTNLDGDWTRVTYILIRFKEGKSVLIRINQDTQG